MKLFAHLPLIHEKRPLKHNLLKTDFKHVQLYLVRKYIWKIVFWLVGMYLTYV